MIFLVSEIVLSCRLWCVIQLNFIFEFFTTKIDVKPSFMNMYCYDLWGSCSRESMKGPFDDEKFISKRNFSVKQAPSAEVIYNYAIHTQRSTANSKENTTQRYYLS